MEHPECMKKIGTMFQDWIKSDTRETVRPTPDLRSQIYYYGMQSTGTETEWNLMFELFAKEQDASEKSKLLSGLCSINQPWILRKLIDLASKDETYVRSQDYFSLLSSIAANRVGESIVWDYVRDNWQKMVDRFGLNERYLGRMIQASVLASPQN